MAERECFCDNPWYYDYNGLMHCPQPGTILSCQNYNDIKYKYMNKENKQCLKECPSNYKYHFNYECYESCNEINDKYNYNVKTVESSFECKCQNLWSINHFPLEHIDKIVCYDKEINECSVIAPDAFYINSTKQCVFDYLECPKYSYKFNHICYDKCPEFTIESKDENLTSGFDDICICDKNNYLWLEYEKYGNIYLQCGLTTCPNKYIDAGKEYPRKNLLENQNKCVRSCLEDRTVGNKYKYSFRDICIQECPLLTELNYDQCDFIDLEDEDKIDNLQDLKEAANIQAKELYQKSDHISGFLMNKFDASLQIYTLNKFTPYKSLSMKSNLTYIDLGTCLDKIYSDNNLDKNDSIIVTKYDLLTRNADGNEDNVDNKFLINQVEYEFYSMKK